MGEGSTDVWNMVPHDGRRYSTDWFRSGGDDCQIVQEESKNQHVSQTDWQDSDIYYSGVGSMGAPGAGAPTDFLSEALQDSTLIVTAKYCGVCMLHNTSRLPIRHY